LIDGAVHGDDSCVESVSSGGYNRAEPFSEDASTDYDTQSIADDDARPRYPRVPPGAFHELVARSPAVARNTARHKHRVGLAFLRRIIRRIIIFPYHL